MLKRVDDGAMFSLVDSGVAAEAAAGGGRGVVLFGQTFPASRPSPLRWVWLMV